MFPLFKIENLVTAQMLIAIVNYEVSSTICFFYQKVNGVYDRSCEGMSAYLL